jgi:hypothetical protein
MAVSPPGGASLRAVIVKVILTIETVFTNTYCLGWHRKLQGQEQA